MTTAFHLAIASEQEQAKLKQIDDVLDTLANMSLSGPDGQPIDLPTSAQEVLRYAVHHLAQGQALNVIPAQEEVTTQEAAEILHVSRPYLIKLLDEGAIPFVTVGRHRRIRLNDLLLYKRLRDTQRRESLARLVQLSEEMGLYDDE